MHEKIKKLFYREAQNFLDFYILDSNKNLMIFFSHPVGTGAVPGGGAHLNRVNHCPYLQGGTKVE